MQLTATELDPGLDPFSVVGRFLMRNLISRAQAGVEPKRLFYDVSKLKVRAERLIESFERISGARPGPRLQVDVRGISPLERTIRVAARRLSLAVTAGSALVATGATAAAVNVASWADHPGASAGVHRAAGAGLAARRAPRLAAAAQYARHAALEHESDHAHDRTEDRPLEPSPHVPTLAQLEARGAAEIDPGAAAALDDPDHHGLAGPAANDDPRARVDVQPRHLPARATAAAGRARGGHVRAEELQHHAADRVAVQLQVLNVHLSSLLLRIVPS
jgi:hypothetical protein